MNVSLLPLKRPEIKGNQIMWSEQVKGANVMVNVERQINANYFAPGSAQFFDFNSREDQHI